MSKHTPGPWEVSKEGDYVFHRHGSVVMWITGKMYKPNEKANARLIAAAPDMHKDLTRCLDTLCLLMEYELDGTLMRFLSDLIDEVSATVDKAEGKE